MEEVRRGLVKYEIPGQGSRRTDQLRDPKRFSNTESHERRPGRRRRDRGLQSGRIGARADAAGAHVQVVMTARRQEFVRPLTFAALTGRKVITDLFSGQPRGDTLERRRTHRRGAGERTAGRRARHRRSAGQVRARSGGRFPLHAYLAFTGPVVLAPAMNTNMWNHPATQANLETLRRRGHLIVEPDDGFLACGMVGPGRLADPRARSPPPSKARIHRRRDLEGETVLITAGPTQEPLDPVRYISNRSSGKMGYALAEAAAARGANVMLVSGPCICRRRAAHVIPVRTAQEMREQVFANLDAPPSSSRPRPWPTTTWRECPQQKVKKTAARFSLELDPTPDILAELGRKKGDRLLVGFAAETENLAQEARRKLESKNCDMIVGNLVGAATWFRIRPERSDAGAAHRRDDRAAAGLEARNRGPDLRRDPETAPGAARTRWTLTNFAGISSSTRIWGSDALPPRRYRRRPPSRTAGRSQHASRPLRNYPRSRPQATRCSRSSRTSAIAAAAGCTRAATRSSSASGNEQAKLVFVGEGPGADEDAQGIPFVGRAGQLLTQMIENTSKKEGIPLQRRTSTSAT